MHKLSLVFEMAVIPVLIGTWMSILWENPTSKKSERFYLVMSHIFEPIKKTYLMPIV